MLLDLAQGINIPVEAALAKYIFNIFETVFDCDGNSMKLLH